MVTYENVTYNFVSSKTFFIFLQAIIDGETIFGQENLKKYRLGTSANIIRIKDALLSKEIIDITAKKIEIQDPIFKLWLKEECFKNKISLTQ